MVNERSKLKKMVNPMNKDIGARIHSLRKSKGLSLRALAQRSGLSGNAISLIERGKNSPTINTLYQLALGLEIPVIEFFRDGNEKHAIYIKNDQGFRYTYEYVEMESLGSGLPNQKIEAYRITIKPNGKMLRDPITHPGQEFVYGLEGRIDYMVGDKRYQLGSGDSLLLDSTQPHCWCNATDKIAKILLVFFSPLEGQISAQGHLMI